MLGLILDEAPFISIVDFQRFAVRLSTVSVQEGQAGDPQPFPNTSCSTYTPYKAIWIQYIVRTEYKANNIGEITTCAGVAEPHSPPMGSRLSRV